MALDDDIAILGAAPVFGFFDRDALRLLCFAGERIELQPGDTLFRRGERADGGYVVLSGTIALVPKRGGDAITAGRSALIGRNALFKAGERPVEARAETASEVVRISIQLMGRMLKEFPEAAASIHEWLAEDLSKLVRDLDRVRTKLVDIPRR